MSVHALDEVRWVSKIFSKKKTYVARMRLHGKHA